VGLVIPKATTIEPNNLFPKANDLFPKATTHVPQLLFGKSQPTTTFSKVTAQPNTPLSFLWHISEDLPIVKTVKSLNQPNSRDDQG
jgi:hypothetical protein